MKVYQRCQRPSDKREKSLDIIFSYFFTRTLYTYRLNFCLFFIFRCRQADIDSTVLLPVSLSTTQVKKFIGGVVDIGEQFFGGVVDTGNKF
jgi:hypothetical protein